jgi:hypothetical protein
MVDTTRSPRRSAALLGAGALVALLALAGCSSSGKDASPADTATATTAASGTSITSGGTAGTTATTGSSDPIPTSPSTLPASVAGTCAALAQTYGLDQIQPKNTSSWVDERQRIVVDAQRESQLLAAAQPGAPADVAARLVTMQTYASWLATTVQGAAGFSAAVAAVDAYPDQVGVSLAAASVATWRAANCPD